MKQHITREQLSELSDEKRDLLLEDLRDKGDGSYVGEMTCPDCGNSGLPNIGRMIGFLEENYNEIAVGFNDSGVYWHVHVGSRGTGNMLEGFGKTYDSNEDEQDLVDALWEACKEVLNRK